MTHAASNLSACSASAAAGECLSLGYYEKDDQTTVTHAASNLNACSAAGEFLSLGYYEKDDLTTVVEYLNEKCDRVTRIGIWCVGGGGGGGGGECCSRSALC